MRLVSCHIENFGVLSNFDISFEEGLHTIYQENGWGKSTFATFLKVMFYGFANEKKRGLLEKERTKYKPWQGGTYGGSLVFEANGKRYLVERIFGEKEREDFFAVYDENTGLPSEDFSSEIGKELFQLDEHSFQRTIFLSQADCVTYATDSVHAKIGNLVEQIHDVEAFSDAKKILLQGMNRLTERRKTGEIYKLKEKKAEYEEQIRLFEKQGQEEIQEKVLQQEQKKENLLQEIEQLQEKLNAVGDIKEKNAKLEHYEQLCEQYTEREHLLEAFDDDFGNGIPEKEEVKELLSYGEQEQTNQVILEQNKLSEMEEHVYQWIKEKWEQIPTQEDIQQIKDLDTEEKDAQEPEEEKKEKQKAIPTVGVVGVLLSIIGVCICFWKPIIGCVLFSFGLLAGFIGMKEKEKKEKRVETEQEEESQENRIIENSSKETLHTFCEKYPVENVTDESQHFECIQMYCIQYDSVKERVVKREEAEEKYNKAKEMLDMFFQKYGLQRDENVSFQLQSILGKLERYEVCLDEFLKASDQKEAFEQNHDIDALKNQNLSIETTEELQETIKKKQEEIENLNQKIYEFRQKEQYFIEKEEEMVSIQNKIEEITEQIEKKEKKLFVMEQALSYLQKAKEEFTGKYRSPLNAGFEKYCSYISKSPISFLMDSNIEIRVKKMGAYREAKAFSVGWQDLFGICQRFALADAMFETEKPFLVLDDPFVNLDEEKLAGALELVKKASEEYQIIYFTCHESRSL